MHGYCNDFLKRWMAQDRLPKFPFLGFDPNRN